MQSDLTKSLEDGSSFSEKVAKLTKKGIASAKAFLTKEKMAEMLENKAASYAADISAELVTHLIAVITG